VHSLLDTSTPRFLQFHLLKFKTSAYELVSLGWERGNMLIKQNKATDAYSTGGWFVWSFRLHSVKFWAYSI